MAVSSGIQELKTPYRTPRANEELAFAFQYWHGVGLAIWEKPVFSLLVSFEAPEEIEYRCWQAKEITERHGVQLIFVFLAMPWVLRAVAKSAYFPLTKRTAVILDNWMDYKNLAKPNFEGFNSLSYDNEFRIRKEI